MSTKTQPMSLEDAIAGLRHHLAKIPEKYKCIGKTGIDLLFLETDETTCSVEILKVAIGQKNRKKAFTVVQGGAT